MYNTDFVFENKSNITHIDRPVRLKANNQDGTKVDVIIILDDATLERIIEVKGDLDTYKNEIQKHTKSVAKALMPFQKENSSLIQETVGVSSQTNYFKRLSNGMIIQKSLKANDETAYRLYFGL